MRLQFVRRWNERKRQRRGEKVFSKEKREPGKKVSLQFKTSHWPWIVWRVLMTGEIEGERKTKKEGKIAQNGKVRDN